MKLRLKYQLVLYYILVIAIVAIAILVYIEGMLTNGFFRMVLGRFVIV